MALSIEFLQSQDDIREFVEFLYMNGCFLWNRNTKKCSDVLTQERAVNALIGDLFTPFGTYYIGASDRTILLYLDSCGRQSHPRNLGKRGRFAGRVVCENKNDNVAIELFKSIKSYFKRTYTYQRYNGNARMCCFFGPYYLKLDQDYSASPEPDEVCPGYLRIVCKPEYKSCVSEVVTKIYSDSQAISWISTNWYPYWEDGNLIELRCELLYRYSVVDYSKFVVWANKLAIDQPVFVKNTNLHMYAVSQFSLGELKEEQKINISFVMEHPLIRN